MFATEYDGKKYEFFDDWLTVNGASIPYSGMSNITHRRGSGQENTDPAFLFDYEGRRFKLSYHQEELKSILPYFMRAEKIATAMESGRPAEAAGEAAPEPEIEFDSEATEAGDTFESETSDLDQVFDPEAVKTEAGDSLESPKKRFWTRGKLIAEVIVTLVVLIGIMYSYTHMAGDSGAQDDGATETLNAAGQDAVMREVDERSAAATQEDTVEATDGFTVVDYNGTVKVVLKKAYVGDAALTKLTEMGEYASDFEEANDPAYKTVLYEYSVKVLEGVLDGDPVTGDAYYDDKKTELDDCWGYILDANWDKDITTGSFHLDTGKSATVYAVYSMPADLTDYYEQVYVDPNNRTIWVHYVLE